MNTILPSTSRSLPIALLRARERVMGPLRAMLSEVGITEQQWRVLRVLQESGASEPTRIAEQACLLLPSLTRILQKLDDKKLIVRQRNKIDKRRQIVSVTEKGAGLIAANLGTAQSQTEQLRNGMGAENFEKLLDLLNELDNTGNDETT